MESENSPKSRLLRSLPGLCNISNAVRAASPKVRSVHHGFCTCCGHASGKKLEARRTRSASSFQGWGYILPGDVQSGFVDGGVVRISDGRPGRDGAGGASRREASLRAACKGRLRRPLHCSSSSTWDAMLLPARTAKQQQAHSLNLILVQGFESANSSIPIFLRIQSVKQGFYNMDIRPFGQKGKRPLSAQSYRNLDPPALEGKCHFFKAVSLKLRRLTESRRI